MKKRCNKCGSMKRLSEFYRHAKTKDGRTAECTQCTRARAAIGNAKRVKKDKANKKPKTREKKEVLENAGDDFEPEEDKNFIQTHHDPGSYGKIEILKLRAANNQPLWHEHDKQGQNTSYRIFGNLLRGDDDNERPGSEA